MAFIAYSILRRPAEMLAQISSCVSSDQGQDGEAGWASPEASAEPILFSLGRARAQLPTMLSGFSVPSLPKQETLGTSQTIFLSSIAVSRPCDEAGPQSVTR
jgi:hypothetical protein